MAEAKSPEVKLMFSYLNMLRMFSIVLRPQIWQRERSCQSRSG
jgi:hypothetical protein